MAYKTPSFYRERDRRGKGSGTPPSSLPPPDPCRPPRPSPPSPSPQSGVRLSPHSTFHHISHLWFFLYLIYDINTQPANDSSNLGSKTDPVFKYISSNFPPFPSPLTSLPVITSPTGSPPTRSRGRPPPPSRALRSPLSHRGPFLSVHFSSKGTTQAS